MEKEKKRIVKTFTGLTIYPYKRGQCKSLENITSVSKYPRGREPFNGYYVKPKTFACRPFDRGMLEEMLPSYEIIGSVRYKDHPIRPFVFHSNIELSDIQSSFCEQMMGMSNNRIFCKLQTGYGKTFIMIYMISQILMRTIIICYSTTVLNQWKRSLENHTSFDPKRLMILSSSHTLRKIAIGEKDVSDIDIFLCTPTLIGSYASQYGWGSVSDLFEKLQIGIKVYDEAHRNLKAMTLIDAFTNVQRNFYLSAEYYQSNTAKSKLFFQSFYDAPIVEVSKDVEKGMRYINAIVVNFNSNPSELVEMQVIRENYGFSNFEYMKYQFANGKILDVLASLLLSIVDNNSDGKKILIATGMIEHVQIIYEFLKDRYPSYHPAMLYSELSDEEKEYAKTKSDMIIATIGSFGPGVDIKNIRYVIAMDQFDFITDSQLSGRARPDNGSKAFYMMLNDVGFDYCVKKIRKRVNYLAKTKLDHIFYTSI